MSIDIYRVFHGDAVLSAEAISHTQGGVTLNYTISVALAEAYKRCPLSHSECPHCNDFISNVARGRGT